MKKLAAVLLVIMLTGCSKIIEDVPDVNDSLSDSPSVSYEHDDSRYIYSELSAKEREYYDIIAAAARAHEETARFPEKVEPDTLRKLFIAVYYEEEDIFWLASFFENPRHATNKLTLYYRFEDMDTEQMKAEIDAETDRIFSAFDDDTSDYEKLLAFHDQIVLTTTFEDDENYARTIYGALSKGIAQCVGYAKTFDYLCSLAGIDCMTVMGTNENGLPHSWNIVSLEGKWYHVDCTWDDPILDPVDEEFFRHYYFLVKDSDILGITHSLDTQYFTYPACTADDNYYVREGLVPKWGAESGGILKDLAVKRINEGHKDIAVRLKDESAYSVAKTLLFETGGMRDVLDTVNSQCSTKVCNDRYIRYLNDDLFIIHITMIYKDETKSE
ncbi:MAG: hypothetical protein IJ080_04355 [Oscillospiraceae bacterium]|nr:hypothetical protein [Oscillospiraceae bacterium]MBQ8978979.1 hypothetical protein [Oscillospiraceae bacterium]